jgi:hypothetical protein
MKRSIGITVITASLLAIVLAVAAWSMDRSGARPKAGSHGGRVIT